MSKFGWSYPPGCSGLLEGGEQACSICGLEAGWCQCPECPACGVQGDPKCYEAGHLPGPMPAKVVAEPEPEPDFGDDEIERIRWESLTDEQREAEIREVVGGDPE